MLASLSGCAILRFALQAILPLRRVPYYVYCLRLVSEDNDSPSVAPKKKTARDRATLRPELRQHKDVSVGSDLQSVTKLVPFDFKGVQTPQTKTLYIFEVQSSRTYLYSLFSRSLEPKGVNYANYYSIGLVHVVDDQHCFNGSLVEFSSASSHNVHHEH